jgi:hypothetical protein
VIVQGEGVVLFDPAVSRVFVDSFEGRRRAGCQLAVEFRDPDGNNLEIYWSIDQIGTNGVGRPASEWRPAPTLEDAIKNPVAGQRFSPTLPGLAIGATAPFSGACRDKARPRTPLAGRSRRSVVGRRRLA